ncbi:MAG: type II toxin-antitoxin system RelE/ParE family toxin [Candidatus Kapabacteria bacterium]|nr:type II toxin-antitoxin system RelE/ParE family toxin [Candidatus Kapabacteria bacterium]
MDFHVLIPKPVLKYFNVLPDKDRQKILLKLQILEKNPKPIGSLKLQGQEEQYRIRSGDYRIRYLINQNKGEIAILDIAHRKNIYKKK